MTPAVLLAALAVAGTPAPAAGARCADCHPRPAAEWELSGHAQAWSSPIFQAGLAVEPRRFCVDCHAPDASAAAAWRGIGCASCHAEGTAHDARANVALRDAGFCKRCHEFATPEWVGAEMRMTALPMQSTFTEWEAFQRAGGAGTCQSCHMPGGDHRMHGAHDVELLRGALDVTATFVDGAVTFTVRSVNVGHRTPTGDLFRNLTLEIAEGGEWRTVHRIGRRFEAQLDGATLVAHQLETANTTLAPGEARLVTVAARAPVDWRVRYHYGSERDELRARVSYDALVATVAQGTARAGAAPDAGVAAPKMPAGFVDLADVATGIAVDMRYAGAGNFVGRPVRGYGVARCLLTKQAAAALAEVQRDLATSGLGLLVYDCYRPQRAVDDFVAWARDPAGAATIPAYHPAVPRAELFNRGYVAARSGHSRGSTVDVTLVSAGRRKRPATEARDCRAVEGALAPDGSLNMGTTFDCFDPRSHGDDTLAPPAARRNRLRLRRAMERRGFVPYAKEWWHFTLAGEPFPETAFDFEIQR